MLSGTRPYEGTTESSVMGSTCWGNVRPAAARKRRGGPLAVILSA